MAESILHHIVTDAALSSSMWMVSDSIAQHVEINCGLFAPAPDIQTAQGLDIVKAEHHKQEYDCWRTARFGIVGIPSGIWLHGWFRLLDFWFPKKTFGTVVLMAAIDWVGECPYILSNMSMNAYLERCDCNQVAKTIKNDYCACNLWNLMFWFPADIVMFYYIPVKWQLLVVRAADLVFLPVDSYFSNRSISKPGVSDLAAENELEEEEAVPVGSTPKWSETLPEGVAKPRDEGCCANAGCTVM
eukprot:Hpha_TRINITY_DN17003_c3_g2::TRINITY_DN17003_c3_g2_i1::g.166106::m.166106/K13348/MPV17; protein Mpv17